MHQEVYQLLSRNKNINFAGNMEGRDIFPASMTSSSPTGSPATWP